MHQDGKHIVDDCIDREFVFELCKRGHVNVLSRQVSIRGESIDLKGVVIPKGCQIEFVSAKATKDEYRPEITITFGWRDE